VDYAHAMISETSFGQRGMNFRFVPYEVESRDFFVGLQSPLGAFDDDTTPVVTTHDIHSDSHNPSGCGLDRAADLKD